MLHVPIEMLHVPIEMLHVPIVCSKACPVNKTHEKWLEFTINRTQMELFELLLSMSAIAKLYNH